MNKTDTQSFADLIAASQHIIVIQADNPDADSLGSALALEHILGDLGKEVSLYCGVDIPKYLYFLPGHDRVSKELPKKFDASILVDCSTITLLEQLEKTHQLGMLKTKPFAILDHHQSEVQIPFDHQIITDTSVVSTGEIIYNISMQHNWPVNSEAAELMASSILADSLGLTIDGVGAKTVHVLAELVEKGADLAKLDARRRLNSAKPLSIIAYKAKLIERIEYQLDDQLALIVIPWSEIETYSPLYNPGVLALEELRFAEKVKLAIAIKTYPDGKITGKLRCNYGCAIAGDLAAHFGGGGHKAASGFKTFDWKLDELKIELIKQARILLEAEQS